MAEISRSEASLRFIGDDLDPEHVSQQLGIDPTSYMTKGRPHRLPNGRDINGGTGAWSIRAATSSPADLNEQVQELLTSIDTEEATIRNLAQRFDGHIFVGLFLEEGGEGTRLDPQTMAALASKGLGLELDIYLIGNDPDAHADNP